MRDPSPPPPFRPLPIRALNAIGRTLERRGRALFDLDPDALLARARKATGLTDFGDPSFRPGYLRLLRSLEADARLSAFGRFFARRQIHELLVHRLELTAHRRQHPEIARERIERPIFVIGLPRTGTSLLHGLLACDPAHRAPLSWEVDAPCPPPETASYDTDPRIAAAEKRFEQVRRLAPGFQTVHPIGALLPQECIVITASEFMSLRFEMCFDVAGYQQWLLEQDLRPAYRHHRRFLQHLQARHARDRWVLKSPGHLGAIDALLEVYPDALLIQTHRDPLRVIPSVASLELHMRRVASDRIDPFELGRQQRCVWKRLFEQGMAARERMPERERQFVDIQFRDLAADPIGCVRRIYTHFGLELRSDSEARMRAYLAEHPRDEHGVHRYSLAQFGLDAGELRRDFERYCARFGVPREVAD
jgi:hypothetical protein